jgi:hypothetical protein
VGEYSAGKKILKSVGKVGKVGEVGKVSREVYSCPHGVSCDCRSTEEFLLSPGKIFCLC